MAQHTIQVRLDIEFVDGTTPSLPLILQWIATRLNCNTNHAKVVVTFLRGS